MWGRKRATSSAEVTAQDVEAGAHRDTQTDDHQRVRDFVTALDLPSASSIRDLVPFVEQYTGRPIQLVPVTDPSALPRNKDATSTCGMWLRTDDVDRIFYDATISSEHSNGIIGHELGHILLRHREVDDDLLESVGTLGGLLPDMNPNLIRMLLGRTARYAVPDEADAETVGSLLLEHVQHSCSDVEPDDPISRTLLRRPR
ncbi:MULTISPECIES: hypothetical protein [unclassified Streptomyces]|uniref:hypothetical protein n=1 Tax=unclassified Streptomyces TaxID=2593676 RepID=UPI0035D5E76F